MNLPNALTLSRIIIIPLFVIAYYLPVDWNKAACGTLFIVASITDGLDGYLARKLDQMTAFGAFLDPVADKLMVAIALAVIIEDFSTMWVTVPAMIIIGREIVVSALREWMAERGKRDEVAVSYIGKVKTTAQMTAIFIMLVSRPDETLWYWSGMFCLYIAAILTMYSMYLYISLSWHHLFADDEQSDSK